MPATSGGRRVGAYLLLLLLPLFLDGSTPISAALYDEYLVTGRKTQVVDRRAFFKKVRTYFHKRGLKAEQVATYNAILDYWDERPRMVDLRWLAYILGTALHESGNRMTPVREALGNSDDQTIARLDRSGGIYARLRRQGKTFWRRQPQHGNRAYFGRGLIQITHAYNYKRMGREIGLGDELYLNPNLALDPEISVKLLYVGMVKGLYRRDRRGPHALPRYFSPKLKGPRQWIRARNIVNGGLFHADKIASKSKKFLKSIRLIPADAIAPAEKDDAKKPPTVPEVIAPPDDPQAVADAREQEIARKDDELVARQEEIERLKKQLLAKAFALEETRRALEETRAEVRVAKEVLTTAQRELDAAKEQAAAAGQTPRITEAMIREALRFEFAALRRELKGVNQALGAVRGEVRAIRQEGQARQEP